MNDSPYRLPALPSAERANRDNESCTVFVLDPEYFSDNDTGGWTADSIREVFKWTGLPSAADFDYFEGPILVAPFTSVLDIMSSANGFWDAWEQFANGFRDMPTIVDMCFTNYEGSGDCFQFGPWPLRLTARSILTYIYPKEFFDKYASDADAWQQILTDHLAGRLDTERWQRATQTGKSILELFAEGQVTVLPEKSASGSANPEVYLIGCFESEPDQAFRLETSDDPACHI